MYCYLNPPDTQPDVSFPGFRERSRSSRVSRKNPLNPENFLFLSAQHYPEMFPSRAAFTVMRQEFLSGSKMFLPVPHMKDGSTGLSLGIFQVPAIFQLMYFECLGKDNPINNLLVLWGGFILPATIACQYVHYLLPTTLLNGSGLQIASLVGRTDYSPAILSKLESNYWTLNNGAQISGFSKHSL